MSTARRLVWLACLLVGCSRRPAVRVAAAVSLEPWLSGVLANYRGATVEATYGASGILARQISAGAPVEVFLSASPVEVDDLGARVRARRDIASNRLVLALSREGAAVIHRPEDLASAAVHRIALGRPQSVPAGRYAQVALERLSLWRTLQPKLLFANHVAEVRAWIARGDAEAGFVYASEAAGLPAALPLPTAPEARIVAALLGGGEAAGPAPAARSLYEFLTSRDRLASLSSAGFGPP